MKALAIRRGVERPHTKHVGFFSARGIECTICSTGYRVYIPDGVAAGSINSIRGRMRDKVMRSISRTLNPI